MVEAKVVDVGVRREALVHGGKIDRTMVLVDLDGVAAAKGDVRAAFTGKVREDALATDDAGGVGGAGVDLASFV